MWCLLEVYIKPERVGEWLVLSYLNVTQRHALYYTELGNRAGLPVLFVHGGPGSSCNPAHAQWLLPETCRIIQFDQRGCGHSTPSGSLLGNHTAALVQDMEALRRHLGIHRWVVYGGSWGATLALEYAKRFPLHVMGLLLRGTFLARREDWEWFSTPEGVAQYYPEAYQTLRKALGTHVGENPVNSLYRHLINPRLPLETAYRYALAWEHWEATVIGVPLPAFHPDPQVWKERVNRAKVHAHYCVNDFFLPPEGVLSGLEMAQQVSTILVHGIHDRVCRYSSAQALQAVLPQAQVMPVEAGHGMHEPALQRALQMGMAYLNSNLLPT